MRPKWKLPGPTPKQRLISIGTIVLLVWAAIAILLVAWLSSRDQGTPPPPAERELAVMEKAAAHGAASSVQDGFIKVSGAVVSETAHLAVEETVQADTGESVGKVISGSESANMVVTGGNVFLRGSSEFWSRVGVPTSYAGWVNVGTHLGKLDFPLSTAAKAVSEDTDACVITAESDEKQVTYRNAKSGAKFTAQGLSSITFDGRTVTIASGDNVAQAINEARVGTAVSGKLNGNPGALTVVEPPKPPAPKRDNP